MKTTRFAALTAALGLALTAGSALAATTSTQFNVTITITESCTFSTTATDVAFGNVVRQTAQTATGNLYVTCTNGTPYTIALNNGSHSSGTTTTATSRRMYSSATSSYVPYGLYTGSTLATVWGDGTNSTGTVGGTGTAAQQTVPVYGQVAAASTNVAAGSYSDVVTATITY